MKATETVAAMLFLGCAVLAFALPTGAQTASGDEATDPKTAEASGPESIPTGLIAGRLEDTASLLRGVAAQASADTTGAKIQESFGDLNGQIQDLAEVTESLLARDPSFEEIEDLQSFWRHSLRTLRSWGTTMESRTNDLESKLEDLGDQEEQWDLTLEQAEARVLEPRTIDRLRSTVSSLGEAKGVVRDARNRALEIQTAIADLQIEVDGVTERINGAADSKRTDLFEFDRAPIWSLSGRSTAAETAAASAGASSRPPFLGDRTVVANYMRVIRSRLIGQAAFFCVALVALLAIRRKWPQLKDHDDPAVQGLGRVLRRPISAALLLAILAGVALYPDVTRSIANLTWVVLLIPMLRLLPGVLSPELRRSFYGLAVLYLAVRILGLLPEGALYVRFLYLLLALCTGAFLVWAADRVRSVYAAPWSRKAKFFLLVGAVIAGGSAICNVIGAFALGRFLLNGLLQAVYGAVLIVGAYLIVRGLIHLLIRPKEVAATAESPNAPTMRQRAESTFTAIGVIALAVTALAAFSLLQPLFNAIHQTLETTISIGEIEFAVGDVVTFALVLLSSFLFAKALQFVLDAGVYPRVNLQQGIAESISKLLHYLVIFCGLMIAFSAAGIELTSFTVLAGAFGVGLGLGFQSIVTNFVSGLILQFERPIQVGDNVTVGDTSGIVKDIGIRASTVRTWDGADVVIPNGNLISNELTNWTLSDAWRRNDLNVGAAYGSDPKKVLRVLTDLAENHPKVAQHKPPTALFVGFGDNSLNFLLRFWTRVEDAAGVNSDLHIQVNDAFVEADIEIPFPQRDLNVRNIGQIAPAELGGSPGDVGSTGAEAAQGEGLVVKAAPH